jgi:hypothetical protein
MTTIPSYIGTAVAVVAASPATFDSAGYAALTWTAAVGNLVQWGEMGDQSEDIPVTTLAGRTLHTNGARDGGEIPFTYVFGSTDAGQVILRANANTNNAVSVRVTDPDGQVSYATGVVGFIRDAERTASAYKGQTGAFRVNTAVVRA